MVSQDSQPQSRNREGEKRVRGMVKFSAGAGVKKRKTRPLVGPSATAYSSSSCSSEEEDDVSDEINSCDAPENRKESLSIEIDPEVLECSVCYERLSPPVFQCQNGHIACSSCCGKLKKCHSCSWPIGSIRCLALEKLLESIKVPCSYAGNGCKKTYIHAERPSHEETCIYQPCSCPISDCTFKACMQKLPRHFKREHGVSTTRFIYDSFFKVYVEQNKPFYVLRGRDGVIFLLLNYTDTVGNTLIVTCFRPRTEKADLSYGLMVSREGSSLRLEAPVMNIKRWDGVRPSYEFLVVPHVYCDVSGKFKLNICIKKTCP